MRFKKAFCVLLSLALFSSLLSVNCFAFTYTEDNKTQREVVEHFLETLKEAVSDPLNNEKKGACLHAMVEMNTYLVDEVSDTGSDIISSFSAVTNDILNNNGYVSYSDLNGLLDVFARIGFNVADSPIGDWYFNKYGKDYADTTFDTSGCNYYIYFLSADRSWEYRMYLSYDGEPLPVYTNDNGSYFSGFDLGVVYYRQYSRCKYAAGSWSDWSGVLHYGAVLFSQGCGGVCYKIKTRAVRTHAEAVLCADRSHGYIHHDYPYDQ